MPKFILICTTILRVSIFIRGCSFYPRKGGSLSCRNLSIIYTGYRQEGPFSSTFSMFGALFFKIWKYIHTSDQLMEQIRKWRLLYPYGKFDPQHFLTTNESINNHTTLRGVIFVVIFQYLLLFTIYNHEDPFLYDIFYI